MVKMVLLVSIEITSVNSKVRFEKVIEQMKDMNREVLNFGISF